MKTQVSFKGTVTELMTPYLDDFSIDYDGLGQEIEYQIASKVQGIFVNGIASECPFMPMEDHKKMLKYTVDKINGRLPVMANIFLNSTANALELMRSYEENGADAVCLVQPCLYPFAEESLYQHFTTLIKASKLPVYLYNAPQTNNTMSPGLVIRLMNENENVVGYKESTQDLIHVQTIMRKVTRAKEMEFLSGSDGTILPMMQCGGAGIISLISVIFPQLIIDVCDAAFANEKEKGIEAQNKVLAVRDILKSAPFLGGYKYAADLVGAYPGGKVQSPLVDATDKQRAFIKEELQKLGLVK